MDNILSPGFFFGFKIFLKFNINEFFFQKKFLQFSIHPTFNCSHQNREMTWWCENRKSPKSFISRGFPQRTEKKKSKWKNHSVLKELWKRFLLVSTKKLSGLYCVLNTQRQKMSSIFGETKKKIFEWEKELKGQSWDWKWIHDPIRARKEEIFNSFSLSLDFNLNVWQFLSTTLKSIDDNDEVNFYYASMNVISGLYSCWWSCRNEFSMVESISWDFGIKIG